MKDIALRQQIVIGLEALKGMQSAEEIAVSFGVSSSHVETWKDQVICAFKAESVRRGAAKSLADDCRPSPQADFNALFVRLTVPVPVEGSENAMQRE